MLHVMSPCESSFATPPKKPPPKVVQRVREILKAAELDVSAENLSTHISSKELNLLGGALRASMSVAAKSEYAKQKTDTEKRQWMAEFVLDPSFAATEGFNKSTAFDVSSEADNTRWLTEVQLAAPDALGCAEYARIAIQAGELESRPHRLASLAKEGVTEYRFSWQVMKRLQGHKEERGTKATAELTDAEYLEVQQSISAGTSKGVKRKAPAKPKADESVDAKEMRKALGLRGAAVRRCKALLDRCASDALIEDEMEKLLAKGYPPAMREYYERFSAEFSAEIKLAQQNFAAVATQLDAKPTLETVQKSCTTLDDIAKVIEGKHKKYKEQVTNDVKKLLG